MERSNIQLKSNITLKDPTTINLSNTYIVSYVNFEGKSITRNYVGNKDNKKK
mgnify:CR=1 FL=1